MNRIIEGISIYDTVSFVQKKNRISQRHFLTALEQILDKDSAEFSRIRHLYLDSQNAYTRAIVNDLFGGEIES